MDILTKQQIKTQYEIVWDRIKAYHIKRFPGHPDPLFLISNAYPGVWLEHVYDAFVWATLDPSTAYVVKGQVKLFLGNQKSDGQFPCYVLDSSNPSAKSYGKLIGFGQIQECVSFTALCLEAFLLLDDRQLLLEAYEKCAKWDKWLVDNRTVTNRGLIELFCQFDTGHDNSARLADIPGGCPDGDAKNMNLIGGLPLLAPDMNSVFYGSRVALSEMAKLLGKKQESMEWRKKADKVRERLIEVCYDPKDEFFYDVNCNGEFRKFRSIAIANLFQEHVLEADMADNIYNRYMKNPNEFWTKYPFPSMSISDPASRQDRAGNSWGFYSQGLTALRALRWMDFYGKSNDLETLMEAWVSAFVRSDNMKFSQELHPITGQLSQSSQWYSSSMLFFLKAAKRLNYI